MSASAPLRQRQLLNGWWDLLPLPHPNLAQPIRPAGVPDEDAGWRKAAYLVPGFFTDRAYPVGWRNTHTAWARRRLDAPEELLRSRRAYLTVKAAIPLAHVYINGALVYTQEDMFLGEAVDITDALRAGEPRYGRGEPRYGRGENELAVLLTEFPHLPHPKTGEPTLMDYPWGCCVSDTQAGLWQDVALEWRSPAHIAHVCVRTSVRENRLTLRYELTNAGAEPFVGHLHASLVDSASVLPPAGVLPPADHGHSALAIPDLPVSLEPGQTSTLEQSVPWADYVAWFPERPQLYQLQAELRRAPGQGSDAVAAADRGVAAADRGVAVDAISQRFGFREIWTEGHHILLNGRAQRFYGEAYHKTHSHWLRPEYLRQWFAELHDLNMNYVRLATFPHPDYFLDMADEMGIMVCQETALQGATERGIESPALWQRAREHVRRMVRRDGNHPSLMFWSVENEMRCSLDRVPGALIELPRLRALFGELDPTRIAYHEGDSSLWNESADYRRGEQAMISQHYGAASHGLGWWDRARPLNVGALGRFHYASPYVALQWAGDEVFRDYAALSQSLGRDAARTIELARANEVSALCVWNLSGLDNLRSGERRAFTWDDADAPYAKPLSHMPYESEFAWWDEETPYRPGHAFGIIQQALRPLAVVALQERSQFYCDRSVPHTVCIVNDYPHELSGDLTVSLEHEGVTLWEESRPVTVRSGRSHRVSLEVPLLHLCDQGQATLVSRFVSPHAEDEQVRRLQVVNAATRREPLALPAVAVLGESAATAWLKGHGVPTIQLDDRGSVLPGRGSVLPGRDRLDAVATPILVVAENSIRPGSKQHLRLRDFASVGGRVLVLEQEHSPFPKLPIARQPVEMAYRRDLEHPVLAAVNGRGIAREDLRFFGDDPYGVPSSDSWVTLMPYVKPTGNTVVRPILDSSGGDFGVGGLGWSPLVEARVGAGAIIASQLRLSDRLEHLPVADLLLTNILTYLANFEQPAARPIAADEALVARLPRDLPTVPVADLIESQTRRRQVAMLSGSAPRERKPEVWRDFVTHGNTLVVWGLSEALRPYWEQVIRAPIRLLTPVEPVYQLVWPAAPSALLRGLSMEDTCWLENWPYRRTQTKRQSTAETFIVDQLLRIHGGVVHLQNATASGLETLYAQGHTSELDRMPALSAYFDGAEPEVGAGLIEVPVGLGHVIFSQIRWLPEVWQFRRLIGQLYWNLGLPIATDILEGSETPRSTWLSDGSPRQMRVARGVSAEARAELAALSNRRIEHHTENITFAAWPGWRTLATPKRQYSAAGSLRARDIAAVTCRGEGELLIGFQVVCPGPRKRRRLLSGEISDLQRTSLSVEGAGDLSLWINGQPVGLYALAGRKAFVIPDLDLEAGSNQVMVRWTPPNNRATLGLTFVDRHGQPEITFDMV
jgi:hypothetical protein